LYAAACACSNSTLLLLLLVLVLVQAVLAYTPSWGCCCCRLHVREHNLEARGLYHKLGFLEDAVLEDYYGPGKHCYLTLRPWVATGSWGAAA
jgi:ribosomal protein S18 acetylase RimI-like enzyme